MSFLTDGHLNDYVPGLHAKEGIFCFKKNLLKYLILGPLSWFADLIHWLAKLKGKQMTQVDELAPEFQDHMAGLDVVELNQLDTSFSIIQAGHM